MKNVLYKFIWNIYLIFLYFRIVNPDVDSEICVIGHWINIFFGVLAEGIKLTLIFPSLKYKQVQYFHTLLLASRLSAKDTLIEKYD